MPPCAMKRFLLHRTPHGEGYTAARYMHRKTRIRPIGSEERHDEYRHHGGTAWIERNGAMSEK